MPNMDFFVSYFLELLGRNLPALIVLVICASVTLSQWQRHPPSARWAFIAFVWFVVTDLLAIAWYAIGAPLLLADRPDPRLEEAFYSLVLSCCEGLGYVFFLFALNAARTPYRPPSFYDDFIDDTRMPPTPPDGSFTPQMPRDQAEKPNE